MAYNAVKKIIEGGRYDKADLMNKLDLFLLGNRITEEEYKELTALLTQEVTE